MTLNRNSLQVHHQNDAQQNAIIKMTLGRMEHLQLYTVSGNGIEQNCRYLQI